MFTPVLLGVFIFLNFFYFNLNWRIGYFVRNNCSFENDNICYVKLSNFTWFKWSEFWFFENGGYLQDGAKDLGLTFDQSEYERLLSAKLVFKNGKKMSYFERIVYDVDHVQKNYIYFDNKISNPTKKEDDLFIVSRDGYHNNFYYTLSKVEK